MNWGRGKKEMKAQCQELLSVLQYFQWKSSSQTLRFKTKRPVLQTPISTPAHPNGTVEPTTEDRDVSFEPPKISQCSEDFFSHRNILIKVGWIPL